MTTLALPRRELFVPVGWKDKTHKKIIYPDLSKDPWEWYPGPNEEIAGDFEFPLGYLEEMCPNMAAHSGLQPISWSDGSTGTCGFGPGCAPTDASYTPAGGSNPNTIQPATEMAEALSEVAAGLVGIATFMSLHMLPGVSLFEAVVSAAFAAGITNIAGYNMFGIADRLSFGNLNGPYDTNLQQMSGYKYNINPTTGVISFTKL